PAPDVRLKRQKIECHAAECSSLLDACRKRKRSAARYAKCGDVRVGRNSRILVRPCDAEIGARPAHARDGTAQIVILVKSAADQSLQRGIFEKLKPFEVGQRSRIACR